CFFFQAEDGIRDPLVTGVQTCALPIFAQVCQDAPIVAQAPERKVQGKSQINRPFTHSTTLGQMLQRPQCLLEIPHSLAMSRLRGSEERRVGKEWRSRWSRERSTKE